MHQRRDTAAVIEGLAACCIRSSPQALPACHVSHHSKWSRSGRVLQIQTVFARQSEPSMFVIHGHTLAQVGYPHTNDKQQADVKRTLLGVYDNYFPLSRTKVTFLFLFSGEANHDCSGCCLRDRSVVYVHEGLHNRHPGKPCKAAPAVPNSKTRQFFLDSLLEFGDHQVP